MANAIKPNTGLMEVTGNENLTKLKEKIFGSTQPKRSLDYRIGQLTDQERLTFENALKFTMFLQQDQVKRKGYSDISHADTISTINRGISAELKQLVVEVLEHFLDIKIKPKPKEKYDGMSLYDRPEFQPLREAELAAMLGRKPQPTPEPKQSSFREQLEQSESSGQSDAEMTLDDGRKYVGLMQMGKARLTDYMKANNTSFTQEQFKNDPELQDKVGDWHLADIDKAIDALGDEAKAYNRDGLRAAAHISGKIGMKKFVQSKGKYNPSDQLGTSVQDYATKREGIR